MFDIRVRFSQSWGLASSRCLAAEQTASQAQPAHLPGEEEPRWEEKLRPVLTYAADFLLTCSSVCMCVKSKLCLVPPHRRPDLPLPGRGRVRVSDVSTSWCGLICRASRCCEHWWFGVFQLGVGAAEQQGGGAEQGVQRRPGRGWEQHRPGADQVHRGRGEEDERQQQLLRLWSCRSELFRSLSQTNATHEMKQNSKVKHGSPGTHGQVRKVVKLEWGFHLSSWFYGLDLDAFVSEDAD